MPDLIDLKADVIGLDWRISIPEGRNRLQHKFAIQGNLDPTKLMAPQAKLEQYTASILKQGIEEHGYIFNLGHGLFPEASLDKLKALTEYVQQFSVVEGQ